MLAMPTMNYSDYHSRRYFPELDGLRALCILGVITAHMPNPTWQQLGGALGVDVFFVLSGYLITTLALREEAREGRLHLRAFFVRRMFRLLPAYYVILALYAILILVLGLNPERRATFVQLLPMYLLHLQEIPFWSGAAMPFYQSWSLGVEEKFYLLWPVLGFWLLRGRARARLAVAAVGAVGFSSATFLDPRGVFVFFYGAILMGCVAAIALHDRVWFDRLRRLGHPYVLGAIAGLWFITHVSLYHLGVSRAAYAPVVALFLVGLVTSGGAFRRLLSWPPLVYVGTISYGIYLVHALVLNAVALMVPAGLSQIAKDGAVLVGSVALSIMAAEGLRRVIEHPMRELGRGIAVRSQRPRRPGTEGEAQIIAPSADPTRSTVRVLGV